MIETVEVTDDLTAGPWNSGPEYTTELSRTTNANSTQTVVARDIVPVGEDGKRFIRLRVTQ